MKIGMRKPNIKKSIKARTTGKVKRKVKSTFNPVYSKKGIGIVHPKRAVENRIYHKTSFSLLDLIKRLKK